MTEKEIFLKHCEAMYNTIKYLNSQDVLSNNFNIPFVDTAVTISNKNYIMKFSDIKEI